jgi:teichuronic acid biosynthesis glycosyltransferase TuaG
VQINKTEKHDYGKVSIIMPAYNSEKYIGSAIDSVLKQSYFNWELIIVDDCSNDNTAIIIMNKMKNNTKIIYHRLSVNSGAAIARNKAIELSNGEFIAFLDSDDIWKQNKLEVQIEFMKKNNYDFSCTSYNKINEAGENLNSILKPLRKRDYFGVLKYCPGNSTVVYNVNNIGKVYIPDIKKRNDYLMWLIVVKKSKFLYGLDSVLSSHRVREGSLSKKKIDLIKYHLYIYRYENISIFYSIYLVSFLIFKKIIRKQNG